MKNLSLKLRVCGLGFVASVTRLCTSRANPGEKKAVLTLWPQHLARLRPSVLDPRIGSPSHEWLHIVLSFPLQ